MITLYLLLTLTSGDPPQYAVTNKCQPVATKAPCPNCSTCGTNCPCFGGGYYCVEGKCPVQLSYSVTNKVAPAVSPLSPKKSDAGVVVTPQRPFPQVGTTPATNAQRAVPVSTSYQVPGQFGGLTYTLAPVAAPLGIISGGCANGSCGTPQRTTIFGRSR